MEKDTQNDKSCGSDMEVSVFERDATEAFLSEAIQSRRELSQNLTNSFEKIDSDKDGFLTYSELVTLSSSKYAERTFDKTYEASQIAINYHDGLEALSNDEWGFENNGLTKSDIKALAELDSDEAIAEQIDLSLDAYSNLTIGDIKTADAIREELEQGNSIPLATAMDLLGSHEQRVRLISRIGSVGIQNKDSMLPNIKSFSWVPSDSCLLEMRVSGRPNWGLYPQELYLEKYGAASLRRYGPTWQMVPKD